VKQKQLNLIVNSSKINTSRSENRQLQKSKSRNDNFVASSFIKSKKGKDKENKLVQEYYSVCMSSRPESSSKSSTHKNQVKGIKLNKLVENPTTLLDIPRVKTASHAKKDYTAKSSRSYFKSNQLWQSKKLISGRHTQQVLIEQLLVNRHSKY